MFVDTLVVWRDKDEIRSFQPTLWLSSAVEVDLFSSLSVKATRITTEKGQVGLAFFSPCNVFFIIVFFQVILLY